MPKQKRRKTELKDIKEIKLTGIDLFPYGDSEDEVREKLKKAGMPDRAVVKYYSNYVILPEIGDFIHYLDLHESTRLVVSTDGFYFDSMGYTSEDLPEDTSDLISKLDFKNKTTMHIRDLIVKRGFRTSWSYTNRPRTYYDPIGH